MKSSENQEHNEETHPIRSEAVKTLRLALEEARGPSSFGRRRCDGSQQPGQYPLTSWRLQIPQQQFSSRAQLADENSTLRYCAAAVHI